MTNKYDNITIDYKFEQAELDARVFQAEVEYEGNTQGAQGFDHVTGKNFVITDAAIVPIFEDALADAMEAFHVKRAEGYTLHNTQYEFPTVISGNGVVPTISFAMRKPEAVVKARLAEIAKEVEAVYRAELAVKYDVFIEAMAARELHKEELAEEARQAAIAAKAEVKRGQRISALKAELNEAFPA